MQRPIPAATNEVTNEWIHPSVLEQAKIYPRLAHVLRDHPQVVSQLLPLEEEMKKNWPYVEDSIAAKTYSSELEEQVKLQTKRQSPSMTATLVRSGSRLGRSIVRSFSVSRSPRVQAVAVEEVEANLTVVRVVESNKLKKAKRQSAPVPPTINIESDH